MGSRHAVEEAAQAKAPERGYASLQKGLTILQYLQRRGRAKIADISEELDLPVSTTYRYANVLKASGFLVENDGYLVPTHVLAEPASFDVVSQTLVARGAHRLDELRDEFGMTTLLTARVHLVAVCLAVSYAHARHLVSFGRGQARSLYAGASALPLLAHAPQAVIRELLRGDMRSYTAMTLTHEMVEPYLEEVRQRGYAVSAGHLTPGMVGIGVPVIVRGECVCALSVVGEERELRSREESIAARLADAAASFAEQLAGDLSASSATNQVRMPELR